VPDSGMSFSTWRLSSRIHGFADDFRLITQVEADDDWFIVRDVGFSDELAWEVIISGNGPGHYPYGWNVLPDH